MRFRGGPGQIRSQPKGAHRGAGEQRQHAACAQVNYTGSQLFRFNANVAERQYEYSKSPVDLSLNYAFSLPFSVYCDVIDVFRSPIQRRYQYIATREMGRDRTVR